MSKTVVIIAGPTAIGKSELAIQLARHFNTAIVSADSRQCYREMNIGTAKPTTSELALVPHYFIHSHSIQDELNAADYEQLALGYLEEIFKENDIALVVGGTGLYIKALCEGVDEMPEVDETIELDVLQQYEKKGLIWLQNELQEKDPIFFQQAEQQNPHRLLRALIFQLSTGQSIQQYKTGIKKKRPFQILKIGLELPRAQLYDRINQRVEQMMNAGLLEEVRALFPHRHLKSLQTVGYRELFDYFNGKTTLDRAIELIQQHSRNYAKRQMTWFKKDVEFQWYAPADISQILEFINLKLQVNS